MLMAPAAVADTLGDSESVTVNVMLAAGPVVAAVGVPVMAPVEPFSVRPAGSVPALTEYV
jgi:hypothetical protein